MWVKKVDDEEEKWREYMIQDAAPENKENMLTELSKEQIPAIWSISLDCYCPNCEKHVNLLEEANIWESGLEPCETFTKRSDSLEVNCPKCGYGFEAKCEY